MFQKNYLYIYHVSQNSYLEKFHLTQLQEVNQYSNYHIEEWHCHKGHCILSYILMMLSTQNHLNYLLFFPPNPICDTEFRLDCSSKTKCSYYTYCVLFHTKLLLETFLYCIFIMWKGNGENISNKQDYDKHVFCTSNDDIQSDINIK